MNKNTGIILEGGAMRSVFSAGALDFLMEEKVRIPNVMAISAGAYAGMNYASGQKGRGVEAVLNPLREYKYLGFSTFLRKGTFFDMDFLFQDVVQRVPFDFDTFCDGAVRFLISTVNLVTGEAVWHDKFDSQEELFRICRAANSLPFIARVTDIGGAPMLDGGMAEAIPVRKALEEGWEKLVVILTREESYRKKNRLLYLLGIRTVYRRYPKFVRLVEGRAKRYNDALDTLSELEREGRAFVLRPTECIVGNNESDADKLMRCYQHGYDAMKRRFQELMRFLG